ncbi:hypothetical protein UlMin_043677 [Ulmus minor]
MEDELRALEANKTSSIVSLPASHHKIGSKWVYKVKFKADGTVERSKARLVAKAFVYGWSLHQLDVNNAFLHGDLIEEVYMSLPQGYCPKGEALSKNSFLNALMHYNFYLSYSVNKLSQFLVQPRVPHMVAAQGILQYLKGSPSQGLFFPSKSEVHLKAYAKAALPNVAGVHLKIFSDADWSAYLDSKRSISGFYVFLGDSLIS